jgi:REP element-mobilizing transposase RayT
MQLNDAGQIIRSVWNGLAQFHEGIELHVFIIMPNHIHGVIVLRAGVGAIHESLLQSIRESSAPCPSRILARCCCQTW